MGRQRTEKVVLVWRIDAEIKIIESKERREKKDNSRLRDSRDKGQTEKLVVGAQSEKVELK